MYDNINEHIEINLKLLLESGDHHMWKHEFVDENKRRIRNSDRFAQYMEEKGLINIELSKGQRCDLTEFGYEIAKNGGWLEYLKAQELLKQKEKLEYQLKEQVEKVNTAKLTNEYKLSKWKVKTFWWIFGIALFSGAYSIYDIISNIINKENLEENVVTKEEMEYELSKIRTLILNKVKIDSIHRNNTQIDSLKTN